jgi:hypothetical protein
MATLWCALFLLLIVMAAKGDFVVAPADRDSVDEDRDMLVMDRALGEFYHGLPLTQEEKDSLRKKWNQAARQYAQEQGVLAGHALRLHADGLWKNALPWATARTCLREHVPKIVQRRNDRAAADTAQQQAILQQQLAALAADSAASMARMHAFRRQAQALVSSEDDDDEDEPVDPEPASD